VEMCHRPAVGHVQVVLDAMLAELAKLRVSQMARAWTLELPSYVFAICCPAHGVGCIYSSNGSVNGQDSLVGPCCGEDRVVPAEGEN